jgi:hypothetical protein
MDSVGLAAVKQEAQMLAQSLEQARNKAIAQIDAARVVCKVCGVNWTDADPSALIAVAQLIATNKASG